jgi:hypothetical protein
MAQLVKPTAMHFIIFSDRSVSQLADEARIENIFVRARARAAQQGNI